MKNITIYTADELTIIKESLSLDKETGFLYYKELPRNKFESDSSYARYNNRVGQRAGSLGSNGYRSICVRGVHMQEHRAVYFLTHGVMPEVIDHINAIKADNRPVNLRSCSQTENLTYHYANLKANGGGHSRKARAIIGFDKDNPNNWIAYKAVNDVAKSNMNPVAVAHALAGRTKTSYDHVWRYLTDEEIEAGTYRFQAG